MCYNGPIVNQRTDLQYLAKILYDALRLSLLGLKIEASFWLLKKVFWEFLADLE